MKEEREEIISRIEELSGLDNLDLLEADDLADPLIRRGLEQFASDKARLPCQRDKATRLLGCVTDKETP